TLFTTGQTFLRLALAYPGQLLSLIPVHRPTRPAWLLLVLLALPLDLGRVRLGLLHFFLGSLGLPVQRQGGRPRQVLLTVEQVGAVVGLQAFPGTADQALGLVAGHGDDFYRPSVQGLLQGSSPGVGVAVAVVGFQQQEVGSWLDGHQAGVLAVE